MPAISTNTSKVTDSSKQNHVSYVERYISGYGGGGTDENGNPIPSYPIYDNATWYSDAKITNSTVQSSGNVYANNKAVSTQGNQTQENWQADPAPYPHNGGTIISISPGTSGSGSGTVGSGSGNIFINGKKVASVGTSVTTHLGTSTTIENGESNIIIV